MIQLINEIKDIIPTEYKIIKQFNALLKPEERQLIIDKIPLNEAFDLSNSSIQILILKKENKYYKFIYLGTFIITNKFLYIFKDFSFSKKFVKKYEEIVFSGELLEEINITDYMRYIL